MLSLGDDEDDDNAFENQEFSGQDLDDIVEPLPLEESSGEEENDSIVTVPLDRTRLLVRKRPPPDQETSVKVPSSNNNDNKPAAKKRRAPSMGEKKKSTGPSNSIAAMVSCLSGASKPAELADLGEEAMLLLAQAPVVKPRPQISSPGPSGEYSWLRESAAFSSFVPACTDEAFIHESNRVGHTSTVMKEFVEVMTKELADALEEAKQLPRTKHKPGDEVSEASMVKRIRAMEALLVSMDKRVTSTTSKLTMFGTALREHTERHLELMRRHREYVRNLICHFTRTYTFDPDTPGSHLISDPFLMA